MAKKVAERDANTSCPFLGYQPKLPKSVKKLRKF
ncbi:MAG: cyclic lactone autoinducer peptide [Eubacteriales bacterium]|nr:cyclic lactone autoinducer peptide [Eubacteriales bacterium]